jgi:hypothetical protein
MGNQFILYKNKFFIFIFLKDLYKLELLVLTDQNRNFMQ